MSAMWTREYSELRGVASDTSRAVDSSDKQTDKTSGVIFLDIETVPIENIASAIENDKIKPPSNYKSEEKIKEYIDTKLKEIAEKGGLSYKLGRIFSIGLGWYADSKLKTNIICAFKEKAEKKAIKKAAAQIEQLVQLWGRGYPAVVTYNGSEFDLPFLKFRMIYNDVPNTIGWMLNDTRNPRYNYNIDLFRHIPRDIVPNSLDAVVSWLGYKTPKAFDDVADITGADVSRLFEGGDYKKIAKHNKLDLLKLAFLYKKMENYVPLPLGNFYK